MRRSHRFQAVQAITFTIALSLSGFAQEGGGGQAPPSTGGGGGPGGGAAAPTPTPTTPTRPTNPNPNTPTRPGTQPGQEPGFQEMVRPMYLQGRVMLDDGTAPPDPVMLMMICNGQPRPQGYSDMKGRFSVTLGQNQQVFADASVGNINDAGGISMPGGRNAPGGGRGGMTERELMGCEFRAELAGFRSDIVQLAGRRLMDNPDIGTIVLHRMANVQGFTYSLTSANAPKDAKKAYEKGLDLNKKKKYPEAEVQLRKAVETYPKYATAWYELGRSLEQQKKNDEALTAFQKSVEADSKFVGPYLSLLQIAVNQRDMKLIALRSDEVLKLNPFNYPQVWFLNGVANYNLKNLDAAEKSVREALKLDPQHRNPRLMSLLAYILSDKGDYPGSIEQMRGFLSLSPNGPEAPDIKIRLAELERMTGVSATAQTAPAAPKQ
jgi:tetratricopeptide (TPR) repeat protein